jgi:hypothetical protein
MAAELVSLKRTPSEKKEEMPSEYTPPDYGYGTRLSLNEDDMAKLGIERGTIGDTMMLNAKVRVCGYSEGSHETHSHKTLELQITDAALAPAADPNKVDDATALYGKR